VDILITAFSALGAALIVLALAVLWVGARYDATASELSRPAPADQPAPAPSTAASGELSHPAPSDQPAPAPVPRARRFRRQARPRVSTRR
jgi:hypothetical protein